MIWRWRTLLRLINIQRVLVRHGLDELIQKTHFLRPLRFVFALFPKSRVADAPLGERIRVALEELGPIFVKFGQALSTRRDLLPNPALPPASDTLTAEESRMLSDARECTHRASPESLRYVRPGLFAARWIPCNQLFGAFAIVSRSLSPDPAPAQSIV